MPRICLLALIGLPGAGKTRLSNWLLQRTTASGWHVLHLCYDDHFNAAEPDYKTQRNSIYNLLNELIEALRGSAELPARVRRASTSVESEHYLIVCDDNHYYRSMRYRLHQLCRAQGCLYAQLHVATSLSACLLGNEARGAAGVPAAVIHQMQQRLEPPGADAWERHSLTLDDFNLAAAAQTIDEFLETLLNSHTDVTPMEHTKQPQPEPEPEPQPKLQALSHQLDLRLRARILAQMRASTDTQDKAARSRALNEQRKQILAQFRLEMSGKQTDLDDYVSLLN